MVMSVLYSDRETKSKIEIMNIIKSHFSIAFISKFLYNILYSLQEDV